MAIAECNSTHQEMWFFLWAMPKLLWFHCSKPVAQISAAISSSADHAGQPVTSGDCWKSWRPREMFSSLLYRNLRVSNTAATNTTYPNQNQAFSAGKSVFWKLLICCLTETEELTTLCIHMLKLYCLSLAKDDRPKCLHQQAINTGA